MTVNITSLFSDNLDIWTTAVERKSGAGRGGGKKILCYGVDCLRTLILDLAMRGKLVPQEPSDEPARNLLHRVSKAREAFIGKKGREAKSASQPLGHDLPEGWECVTLDELANSQAGFAFKSGGFNEQGIGLPLIRIRDVGQPFTGTFYAGDYREEFVVQRGDYLISMDGNFRVAPWEGEAALLNQRVSRLQFYSDEIEPRFVAIELQVELSKLQGVKAYTTVDHLSGKQIAETRISLPPLPEQRRIVAKVDELMALCDALEAESVEAMAAHQELVEALLATLTASTSAADLATNWTRLQKHFDTLFTSEASIDTLKRTILELAVRGKLVPPDASEDTAATLIKKWENAKQHSFANSGDHRIKVAPKPDTPPFDLPPHWQFQSFENIFLFIDYRGNTPPKTQSGIPLITAKNVRMGYLDREPREFISDDTFSKWMSRGFPALGDLFFTTEAPLGNICLNDIEEPFAIAQRLICFQPFGPTNTHFYMLAIMSQSVQRVIDDNATGMTARGIKAAKLKLIPLPVPPEAEQARIVSKVEELMALCEALRVRIRDAAATQHHLADAVVEQAAA